MAGLEEQATACPLKRVPAEIRNEIFGLALTEHDCGAIASPWPGITSTCKQFRGETLTAYLSDRPLCGEIANLNDKPLLTFLKKLEGLDAELVSLTPSLTIRVTGQLVDVQPRASPSIAACFPNYRFWDTIITHIKASGLRAHQIIWPSNLLEGIEAGTISNANAGLSFPMQLGIESCILYNKILPDALKHYALYYQANPPANVLRKLTDRYGGAMAMRLRRDNDQAGGMKGFGGGRGDEMP